MLAETGRMPLADPKQYGASIHLTQVAAPDLAARAPLAHVRLIAMGRLGQTPELLVGLRSDPFPAMPVPLRGLQSLYDRSRVKRCSSAAYKVRYAMGRATSDYWRFIESDLLSGSSLSLMQSLPNLKGQTR